MKKYMKNMVVLALTATMLISMCPQALAAESGSVTENSVVFSNVSQIAAGEYLQQTILDEDGMEAVVGIERVAARASGETWRVWYQGINNSTEFYMTVSNNKVTSVYDYSISLFGCSYQDAELTKTTTYGKLTYTLVWIGGLGSGTCWLKGTVTGENDEINVTWQM